MTLDAALERALARRFGAKVRRAERLSGGDINDAFAVTLEGGRAVFVKTNDRSPPGMFDAEARGLAWLAQARAVRLPEVLGVGAEGEPPYLMRFTGWYDDHAVQGADDRWRFRRRTVRLWDGEVLKNFPGRGAWVARKRPESLIIRR